MAHPVPPVPFKSGKLNKAEYQARRDACTALHLDALKIEVQNRKQASRRLRRKRMANAFILLAVAGFWASILTPPLHHQVTLTPDLVPKVFLGDCMSTM